MSIQHNRVLPIFLESELMTELHKNTLTKGINKISTNLRSIANICNSLVAEGIFTVEESEEVMNQTTESKKATKLVHYLLKASDGAFFIFRNLLIQTKQDGLANEVYGGKYAIFISENTDMQLSDVAV